MVTPKPKDPATRYTKFPDGRIRDNRYRFARGSKVNLIAGPNVGRLATVDSRITQIMIEGHPEMLPGYHVTLDDGKWATVGWDELDWA